MQNNGPGDPPRKFMEIEQGNEIIDVDFERRKVIIHERYEWLRIVNDLMLGLWFVVGSILFFYNQLVYWGTWLFLAGSVQMCIGPLIQTAHKIHMRRLGHRPKIDSAGPGPSP